MSGWLNFCREHLSFALACVSQDGSTKPLSYTYEINYFRLDNLLELSHYQ